MASFTENMRMATLFPTGNRGEVSRPGPSMWNEFEHQVIPAMERRERNKQRQIEEDEIRHRNMAAGRYPYDTGGALGQIAQQAATGGGQRMAQGRSGDPNAPNSMLEATDKRWEREKDNERADKALKLRENTQQENLNFKQDKQTGDLALKTRIANLKMPEEAKLRLAQELGVATEEVRQTNRLELGDQRGTQQQANIRATGTQQRSTQDVRADNAQDLAQLQGQIRAKAVTNRPVTPTSPYQQNIALNSKASQLFNEHPEWQKYIVRDEKGGFTIVPPGQGGMDEMTHQQITGSIYGNPRTTDIQLPVDPLTKGKTTTTTTTKTPVKAAPVSKYKMTVK